MTYYIKKLDNRHTMKKHGFTHMLEWTYVLNLTDSPKINREYYSIINSAETIFGRRWCAFFNINGRWKSENGQGTAIPPRIYFKSEKYISLVLMAAEIPA